MTQVGEEMIEFAKKAAESFSKGKNITTFTINGEIEGGELFAVRWGLDDDCVLIFRLGFEEPVIFKQFIKEDKNG